MLYISILAMCKYTKCWTTHKIQCCSLSNLTTCSSCNTEAHAFSYCRKEDKIKKKKTEQKHDKLTSEDSDLLLISLRCPPEKVWVLSSLATYKVHKKTDQTGRILRQICIIAECAGNLLWLNNAKENDKKKKKRNKKRKNKQRYKIIKNRIYSLTKIWTFFP